MQNEIVLDLIESVLSALHQQQVNKAKKLAQSINPRLTDEDLLNPDNFPEVVNNPDYLYEDGIAAGILSAKIALRVELKRLESGSV